MTENDQNLLSQYLDGELDSSAALQLKQRLLAEPELNAELQTLKAVNQALQDAYPLPKEDQRQRDLAALLAPAAGNVVEMKPQRRWYFAAAASVAAAVGLVMVSGTQGPATQPQSLMSAYLEATPSRAEGWDALADGREARALLSFRSNEGNWCREYLLRDGSDHTRGVACRDAEGWVITASGAADALGSAAQYRPASSAGSHDAVERFITENAADIPLDATTEQDLISRGWQ